MWWHKTGLAVLSFKYVSKNAMKRTYFSQHGALPCCRLTLLSSQLSDRLALLYFWTLLFALKTNPGAVWGTVPCREGPSTQSEWHHSKAGPFCLAPACFARPCEHSCRTLTWTGFSAVKNTALEVCDTTLPAFLMFGNEESHATSHGSQRHTTCGHN